MTFNILMKKNKLLVTLILLLISSSQLFSQELEQAISSISNSNLQNIENTFLQNKLTEPEDVSPSNDESLKDMAESESTQDTKEEKFGYSFFDKEPSSLVAVGDLPFPNDYSISLKDQFTIILSGSREEIFNLTVKLDGTILFPGLGSISVVGETLSEVKNKIKSLVEQSYIGVDADISLKRLNAKKITIVGAVKNPGIYLVNPFSSISSALVYSGGVLDSGSLRNIKLIRKDSSIVNFDLYDLLVYGDRSSDVNIEAGDTILVEGASNFVELSGSVNRPMIYELKENDSLETLINYGLGFNQTANKNKIALSILNIKNATIDQIETSNMSTMLDNVIKVKIFDYQSEVNDGILVKGAVKESGYYEVSKYNNLESLIKGLKFVNVYPFLGILEQFDRENLSQKTILFNLTDDETFRDVKLTSNSKVYFIDLDNFEDFTLKFHSKFDLDKDLDNEMSFENDRYKDGELIENNKDIRSAKPQGEINPDDIDEELLKIYDFGERTFNSIRDYELSINYGGELIKVPIFGKFKAKSVIDLIGIDVSDVSQYEATYISPLENIVEVADYRQMLFKANKFHNLSFKSPQNNLISVLITGAIEFPGEYTLAENSSLQDLYSLIGQFKDYANPEAIILVRESVRDLQIKSIQRTKADLRSALFVAMQDSSEGSSSNDGFDSLLALEKLNTDFDTDSLGRVAGVFSPDTLEARETILQDNDSIYVPVKSNTVSVIGEVMNPNAFIYDESITFAEAINLAGGYKQFADKKGGYIIKENGLIYKPGVNIFKSERNLDAGDVVVIPRKIVVRNSTIDVVNSLTQVLSQIAFSAAAIESLQNN